MGHVDPLLSQFPGHAFVERPEAEFADRKGGLICPRPLARAAAGKQYAALAAEDRMPALECIRDLSLP